MLASLLIIAASLVLLVYWFRYTCLLLLRNSPAPALSAETSTLSHVQVLREPGAALDPLHRALDRDYRLISYVVQHAAGIEINPLERHLLTADFHFMAFWFRLVRGVAPGAARKALEEMSSILCFFDGRIGRQSA
jgi:hypothetical protein